MQFKYRRSSQILFWNAMCHEQAAVNPRQEQNRTLEMHYE
jgi:hypothetical protein